MGTTKLCVCNRTRKTLVGLKVISFDTTSKTIPSLVNELANISDTGLYLSPFRGIPRDHRISRFDLVYLDERYRVLQSVPHCSADECEAIKGHPDSALALPCGSIESSQLRHGDQLTICDAEVILHQPWQTPASADSVSSLTESVQEQFYCTLDDTYFNPNAAPEQVKAAIGRLAENAEGQKLEKRPWITRVFHYIFPEDAPKNRRRSSRHPLPGLVGYYWTGGAPQAYLVGDISISGVYLLTDERWTLGAGILMTLQRTGIEEMSPDDTISVEARVVRWGLDGLGFEFLPARAISSKTGESLSAKRVDREELPRFLQKLNLPGNKSA